MMSNEGEFERDISYIVWNRRSCVLYLHAEGHAAGDTAWT